MTDRETVRFGIRFGIPNPIRFVIPKPSPIGDSDRTPQQHQQQQNYPIGLICLPGPWSVLTSCASQIQNSPKPTRTYASIGFGVA